MTGRRWEDGWRREQRRAAVAGNRRARRSTSRGPRSTSSTSSRSPSRCWRASPARPRSRAGHFGRGRSPLATRKRLSLAGTASLILSSARFYNRLHLIVSGPLWSRQRFSNIATMQFVIYAPIASSVR